MKFSIGAILMAVVAAAGNLAAMRWINDKNGGLYALLTFFSLPMATSLAFAAFVVAGDLWRRGEARPFHVGFLVLGGIAAAWFAAWVALGTAMVLIESAFMRVEPALVALSNRMGMDGLGDAVGIGIIVVGAWLPQLAVGAIGGCIFSRCGITVVAKGRARAPIASLPDHASGTS